MRDVTIERTIDRPTGRLWLVALVLALVATMLAAPAGAAEQMPTLSRCSGSVCMEVSHTSAGTVTFWRVTYRASSHRCDWARFYVNGEFEQGHYKCGSDYVSEYANVPMYLEPGDRLCATWKDVSGTPCTTL